MAKKKVEFVELPQDGRSKYKDILESIRLSSTGTNAGRWAYLTEFDKVATSRDAASRLTREHSAFEFTSRSNGDGTGGRVYARFIGVSE